jgi:hypothetical protein
VASEAKEDLWKTLVANESKVSLAMDGWTSKNNHAFYGNFHT